MVMRNLPVPSKKGIYILADTKREADRIGVPFGKIADPVGEPVRRVYSLFSWADARGKGGQLLNAFTDLAWAEGVDAGSDAGLSKRCANAPDLTGMRRRTLSAIMIGKSGLKKTDSK